MQRGKQLAVAASKTETKRGFPNVNLASDKTAAGAGNPSADAQALALPLTGLSRWDQLEPLLPVKRVTWERLGHAGRAPKPIRISTRTVCWDNRELHRWFADPEGYRAAA